MTSSSPMSANMVAAQIRPNRVTDERLIAAFEAVPREQFVPKSLARVAYIDEDIEVAPGRYLMEPMVLARLLDEAFIQANDLVLDIGCASGYSSAIIAQLASAVVALEENPALAEAANANLAALGVGNVGVVLGAHAQGHAKCAPYDVIVINGCVETVPDALTAQLAEGGRLVAVVMADGVGRAMLGRKSGGVFSLAPFMDAHVPLLPGFERPKSFQF